MPWSELITNSLWCIFWMHVNQNYDWGFFSALDNPFFTCEFLEFRSLVDQWYLSRQKTKASFFKRQKKSLFFTNLKIVSLLTLSENENEWASSNSTSQGL